MEQSFESTDSIQPKLDCCAVVLDGSGNILDTNTGWKAAADEGGLRLANYGIGANYLKYCIFPERSSIDLLTGLQQVLRREIDCFGTVYPCHSPRQERWFMMIALPTSGPTGCAILHYDISSLMPPVPDPSVLLVSRGPAAADRAQEALAKTVKGAMAEALSRLGSTSREPTDAAPADRRKVAKLSKQDVHLLQLLATGARNAEIGKALGISADAAKFRVVSLNRKLGLRNRTQAAVFAARAGLIES